MSGPGSDPRAAQRTGLRDAGGIVLEDHQAELLCTLVEAHRRVEPREEFLVTQPISADPRDPVSHRGLTDNLMVVPADLRALARIGLIDLTPHPSGLLTFAITPRAMQHYVALQRQGQPVERIERAARRYIQTEAFKNRHPAAYAKWAQAEELLWGTDAQSQLTAIGLHCREAAQDFAAELVARHRPPTFDPDPTKTKNRLRAVVEARRSALGETIADLLAAMVDYWNALVELHQRQTHAAQREGHPLTWEDGRRVVFQTMLVMIEVDRALQ